MRHHEGGWECKCPRRGICSDQQQCRTCHKGSLWSSECVSVQHTERIVHRTEHNSSKINSLWTVTDTVCRCSMDTRRALVAAQQSLARPTWWRWTNTIRWDSMPPHSILTIVRTISSGEDWICNMLQATRLHWASAMCRSSIWPKCRPVEWPIYTPRPVAISGWMPQQMLHATWADRSGENLTLEVELICKWSFNVNDIYKYAICNQLINN